MFVCSTRMISAKKDLLYSTTLSTSFTFCSNLNVKLVLVMPATNAGSEPREEQVEKWGP